MLDIRLNCEHCDKPLPPNSEEALICTFECTWCTTCNDEILKDVCPNCGGNLVPRPIRPKDQLIKYPPKGERVFKPIDLAKFEIKRAELKNVAPKDR